MSFRCLECTYQGDASEVIVLNCQHCFCFVCFEKYLLKNMKNKIECPKERCNGLVEDNQIRQILSDNDLLAYDAKCLEGLPGAHKCVLEICCNITQCPKGKTNYICKKCSLWNCVQCNASHYGIKCKSFITLNSEEAIKLSNIAYKISEEVLCKKIRQSFLEADKQDIFINDKVFECMLCCRCIGKGKGIKLRTCFHYICRPCLISYVKTSKSIPVKCPDGNCTLQVEEREVKNILSPNEYKIYERKSLLQVKNKLPDTYQCQQANCDFFCQLNMKTSQFKCPKCRTINCMKCKAVHSGQNCIDYQKTRRPTDFGVEESIKEGKFMKCPDCDNLVAKSSGCNWIQCPRCNLELCWMLKIRRWGPNGRGDTSDGCRCTQDNLCHPNCSGCIPHQQ